MTKNRRVITIILLLLVMSCLFVISAFAAKLETPAIAKLDVFDSDIREVFRSLGELGNLSVLMDPEVKGTVTVNFKQGVTVQEAIDYLAETYGYTTHWMTANRLVIIGSQKTFENFQTLETRVYHFSYAKVDQVVEAIRNIVPGDKIGIDTRTNQLTIAASILQHQNIEEAIKHLDKEMPQIVIEIRVEEVSKEAKEYLGVPWSKDDVALNFNTLNISTPASKSLEFLESKSLARLLTNPKIATTDGQEGSIFIGEKQPYETSSTQNGVTTYTINWIDVGTTLVVTPRINQDDIVTVNVHAVVSNITEKVKIGGNDIPVTRNRDISSQIRLRDGETFVLSGLSEVQKGESETGLKGVSKIPLIGWLFKTKTTDPNSSKEVCIFITPRIIKMDKDTSDSQNKGITLDKNQSTNTVKSTDSNPTANNNPTDKTVTEQKVTTSELSDNKQTQTDPNTNKDKSENTAKVTTSESTESVTTDEAADTTEDAVVDETDQSEDDTVADDTSIIDESSDTETVTDSDSSDSTTDNLQDVTTESEASTTQEISKVQYQIKAGDTISIIATQFGIAANDIMEENDLKADSKLSIGKKILIPVPASHIYQLKPKETLWRLSKRYGVTVERLMKINGINDVSKVKAGQNIILPVDANNIVNKAF